MRNRKLQTANCKPPTANRHCIRSFFIMRIEHLAIYVKDLEKMKEFYQRYFGAVANEKYVNPKKQFESYFLSFGEGARLEIMRSPNAMDFSDDRRSAIGMAHFAISVGSEEKVNQLTNELINDGFEKLDGPRWTGDGYYESVFLDPENNRVEITI